MTKPLCNPRKTNDCECNDLCDLYVSVSTVSVLNHINTMPAVILGATAEKFDKFNPFLKI